MKKKTKSQNDLFEEMAMEFYEDTGLLAPGKCAPISYTQQDEDKRNELFKVWIKGYTRGQNK